MRIFDPLTEFNTFRREIDRVFDSVRNTTVANRFRTFPQVNIAESEGEVAIEALVPGVDPETINVSVLRNQLTISGNKPALDNVEEDRIHRNERGSGEFNRSFRLPAEIDADKVTAEARNGVLYLTLPKAEAAKPRRIAVNA